MEMVLEIIKNNKNNKKIIMLGDPMTFGWGAKILFSEQLDKKISSHDVLNAGIGTRIQLCKLIIFLKILKIYMIMI